MAIEGRTDPIDEGMLRAINCAFDAGDCDEICLAIGIVLQKRNVSEVARASGTKRETIHRTFLSGQTHPNLRPWLGSLKISLRSFLSRIIMR